MGNLTTKYHEIEEFKEELEELGELVDEQLGHLLHEHKADLAVLESSGASMALISFQSFSMAYGSIFGALRIFAIIKSL